MTVAQKIIERFGGASALARATGWPRTTIAGWERGRGTIPPWRQPDLLAAARAAEIALTSDDFLPRSAAECVRRNASATETGAASQSAPPAQPEAA